MSLPKIVLLDGYTSNPGDLSWAPISRLGDFSIYKRTKDEEVIVRAKEANILIVNKKTITAAHLEQLPQLACICVIATGYNNVDVEAAKKKGIPVCNAVGYGSTAVAQHVFALLLALTNRVETHNKSVEAGEWSNNIDWSYWKSPMVELAGKTMGIYGLGKIGQKVADIALAFDMRVISTHKHPIRDQREGVAFVDLETLFSESDVLSLHAPLTAENAGLVNQSRLNLMKSTAFLINTGRGGLIHEMDLRSSLLSNQIAGAGLDVLSSEPPPTDHPLIGIPNCVITPHHAWAARESRERLIRIVGENIEAFLGGEPQNVVNG